MSLEKTIFDEQIESVKALTSIYEHISRSPGADFIAVDIGYVLRSELVLIVSAFDTYLHHVVRRKLTDDFFSGKPLPKSVKLDMEIGALQQLVDSGLDRAEQKARFENALRERLSKQTYQSSDNVNKAMALLQVKDLWKAASEKAKAAMKAKENLERAEEAETKATEAAKRAKEAAEKITEKVEQEKAAEKATKAAEKAAAMSKKVGELRVAAAEAKKEAEKAAGESPEDVMDQLNRIVHRRNQIAHESDIDLSTLAPRNIDVATVQRCRDFLTKLVECIDSLI